MPTATSGDAKDDAGDGQASAEMPHRSAARPVRIGKREAGVMEVDSGQQHNRLTGVHWTMPRATRRHRPR